MNSFLKKIILLLSISIISSVTYADSTFDCANTSSSLEIAICSNPDLKKLNEENNSLYKKLIDIKPDNARDISQTLYFDLRKCDDQSECLISAYKNSIQNYKQIEVQSKPIIEEKISPKSSNAVPQKNDSNFNINKLIKFISNLGILLLFILTPILFYFKKYSQTKKDGYIKVNQSFSFILYVITSLLMLFFMWIFKTFNVDADCKPDCALSNTSNIFYIAEFVFFLIYNYLWYNWRLGYVINTKENTLRFQSGLFTRKTIEISNISTLNQKEEYYETRKKDGTIDSGYFYYINMILKDGGSHRLRFDSDLESDQFYAVLNSLI